MARHGGAWESAQYLELNRLETIEQANRPWITACNKPVLSLLVNSIPSAAVPVPNSSITFRV